KLGCTWPPAPSDLPLPVAVASRSTFVSKHSDYLPFYPIHLNDNDKKSYVAVHNYCRACYLPTRNGCSCSRSISSLQNWLSAHCSVRSAPVYNRVFHLSH